MNKRSISHSVKLAGLLAFCAVGSLDIAPALAGSATANLGVSSSVTANCTISTSALAFGAYDPVSANLSSPLDGSGMVTVQCTDGAAANIILGQGSNADSGSTDAAPLRRMSDGSSAFLSYSLFTDAARTASWGNTALTGLDHTGTGSSTNLSVYGRIAGGQNVPAGSYSDTVVATVNF